MKLKPWLIHFMQLLTVACVSVFILLAVAALSNPVHALPEYADRTGESCATCHVNPGGGGPRTLRGLLWAAQGRPELVPALPGVLLAPGVTDGAELYDIACTACHGSLGEGLFGREIANTSLNEGKIRSNILRGRIKSGMPAFEGMFTESQLQALVDYVAALATGQAEIPPVEYPLPPAEFGCVPQPDLESCGGNQ